jgi:hypothetical protein
MHKPFGYLNRDESQQKFKYFDDFFFEEFTANVNLNCSLETLTLSNIFSQSTINFDYLSKLVHFQNRTKLVQFFVRREQEKFRSRREQRIFWGSGTAFQNSKTTNIYSN